jgi:hypothetical protein
MIEQRAKGARADILTADEAEPVEPLLGNARPYITIRKIRGLDGIAGRFQSHHVAICSRCFPAISGHFQKLAASPSDMLAT